MRVASFEEGSFFPRSRGSKTLLLGLVMRNFRIEALELDWVTVDGLDATEAILRILERLGKTDVLLLGSIACAGFNLIDVVRLHSKTGVPVVVVLSKKPRPFAAESALIRHFDDWRDRLDILRRAGNPIEVCIGSYTVPLLVCGISVEEAASFVEKLAIFGKQPEPLRVARILARELSKLLPKAYPHDFKA